MDYTLRRQADGCHLTADGYLVSPSPDRKSWIVRTPGRAESAPADTLDDAERMVGQHRSTGQWDREEA